MRWMALNSPLDALRGGNEGWGVGPGAQGGVSVFQLAMPHSAAVTQGGNHDIRTNEPPYGAAGSLSSTVPFEVRMLACIWAVQCQWLARTKRHGLSITSRASVNMVPAKCSAVITFMTTPLGYSGVVSTEKLPTRCLGSGARKRKASNELPGETHLPDAFSAWRAQLRTPDSPNQDAKTWSFASGCRTGKT